MYIFFKKSACKTQNLQWEIAGKDTSVSSWQAPPDTNSFLSVQPFTEKEVLRACPLPPDSRPFLHS